jgi:hypothetical protein
LVSRSIQKSITPEERLNRELDSLKQLLPGGEVLKVCWIPDQEKRLSGEVIGDTIFVYDVAESDATNSLKHEFLDYLFSKKIIEPLTNLINILIEQKSREVYKEKERIIDSLLKLL